MRFILGSDPELMLRSKATGELVSAISVISEGKGMGRPLDKSGLNSVLHDNVLVEFNTKPATSEDEFVATIGNDLTEIQKIVAKHGLELHLQASADFPEKELANEEARIFGCEPDYNAWLLEQNNIPGDAAFRPFRSAGGHLHIGMAEGEEKLNAILADPYGKVDVVKALDIFCGIVSVFLDKDPTSPARRALYGGAGAHRPKEYGVEYRALGNWWLRSPLHTRLVYKLTRVALSVLVEDKLPQLLKTLKEERIQKAINGSDIKEAKRLYARHIKPHLPEELAAEVDSLTELEAVDFQESWGLNKVL